MKTTAWILAATFIPTALLFAWCGRWFKSMEGSVPTFGAMMQQSAQMTADVQAAYPQYPQYPQYGRARWSRVVAWPPAARRCRPAHPRSPMQRPDRPTARMTG